MINGVYTGSNEAFVFKFNSSCSYEWGQLISGAGTVNRIKSVFVDSSNNIYTLGHSNSDITDDGLVSLNGNFSSNYEAFLFKFEPIFE